MRILVGSDFPFWRPSPASFTFFLATFRRLDAAAVARVARRIGSIREERMRKKQSFAVDLRTLESLTRDLVAVSEGSFNFADLENAPVLKHVSIVHRPMQCLEGVVEGHPLLPDGRRIVTSQLWAACDAQALFARTLNRWYRIEKVVDLWGR